jgi:cytochrome bd-type quinol oxidase subunit 1
MKSQNLIIGGIVVAGAGAYFYFKNKGKKSLINSEVAPITQSAPTSAVITSSNKLSASEASAKALQAVSSAKLALVYERENKGKSGSEKMAHYEVLKKVFQEYNKEQVDKLIDIYSEYLLSEGNNLTFEQQIFVKDMEFEKKLKQEFEKIEESKPKYSGNIPTLQMM